jgi:HSP20 family protein
MTIVTCAPAPWRRSIPFNVAEPARTVPPVDITETERELRIDVDLPGLAPGDTELTVENRTLTISGKRQSLARQGEGEAIEHRSERWNGEFQRSFVLPSTVDPSRISAQAEHGVLSIRIEKFQTAQPRRIAIQTTVSA